MFMSHAARDGFSVFFDIHLVLAGQTFQSQMASGLWLGVVVDAQIETSDPVFGRREWCAPCAAGFWVPRPVPNDHHVLRDGTIRSLFVHLDHRALGYLGLKEHELSDWHGRTLLLDGPALQKAQSELRSLTHFPALVDPEGPLAAGRRLTEHFLSSAQFALPQQSNIPPLSEGDLQQVRRARALLLADVRHPPSMTQLARATGMNSRKLTEQFKAAFGLTPFSYLKQYRLNRALDALQHGERPIAEIAAEIGYRPSHLSAAFRERFGCAPSHYRGEAPSLM